MKSRHEILSGNDIMSFRLQLTGMDHKSLAELMNKSEDEIKTMEKLGDCFLDSDASDMLRLVYDTCQDYRENAETDVVFNQLSLDWTEIKMAVHRGAQTGSLRQGLRLWRGLR